MEVIARRDYIFFVFLASVGVLQIAATHAGLTGMLFTRNRWLTYILSIGLMVATFWSFFVRDDRINTIMRHTGLEGSGQFYYFCVGAFAAVVFTMALSSLIHAFRRRRQEPAIQNPEGEGLFLLRHMSYYEAVKHNFQPKEPYHSTGPDCPSLDK